ncbi:MAG: ankyrin repeat domain-containing protein [Janthinobacterium lividum]
MQPGTALPASAPVLRTSTFQAKLVSQAKALPGAGNLPGGERQVARESPSAAHAAQAQESAPPLPGINEATETLTRWLYKFPLMKATRLQAALVGTDPELVASLIASGADINAKDPAFGFSALHFAVGETAEPNTARILQSARLLLEAGAEVSAVAKDGRQPLHEHIGNGFDRVSTKVIDLLLEHGADINARDTQGNAAIHFAAVEKRNPGELIEFLAQRGADINAVDNQGRTALHLVAQQYTGFEYPAEALLNAGADDGIKDREGKTPVDIAKSTHGNWRMAKLFDRRLNPELAAAREAAERDQLGEILMAAYDAERGLNR